MNIKLLIFSALFIVNCTGLSPVAPNPGKVDEPLVKGVVSKNPNTNFFNQLKAEGITLTSENINLVLLYKEIKPSGKWAAESNLSIDFQHFKQSFVPNGPNSESDYHSRALQFAGSTNLYARFYFDTTYYKKRNKILVIKWDTQTKEFIVLHTDGKISNFQLTENIIPPRYIQVPENLFTEQ